MSGAICTALSDRRWHFQHGPIDLVIGADGTAAALAAAWADARDRFAGVLAELVGELALLRRPVTTGDDPARQRPRGRIARCMWDACVPFAPAFVTPLAAVAGGVAQEIAACFARPGIARAWVNNGGDIALVLAPGAHVTIGLCSDARRPAAALSGSLDRVTVPAASAVRGIATSGWPGRSFSLGIADAVTVLAATAAQADAAATLIANAVDVDAPGIVRAPASSLKDDSDLGDRFVTVHVPPLPAAQVEAALRAGTAFAAQCCERGLIEAAWLCVQGRRSGVQRERGCVIPPAPRGGARVALQDPSESIAWSRSPA